MRAALPGKVSTIGNLPEGSWKWHGGVVGADGAIYGIPAHAETVLKVVPATGEVKTIGPGNQILYLRMFVQPGASELRVPGAVRLQCSTICFNTKYCITCYHESYYRNKVRQNIVLRADGGTFQLPWHGTQEALSLASTSGWGLCLAATAASTASRTTHSRS